MKSFLIADDSPEKIMMLKGLIKRAGFDGDLLVAENTEDAASFIDEQKDIGYAFIDYYMPSAKGPSVIRLLKNTIPDAHVALVSSADNADNATEAREAGAEEVLCTGYPADEVESSVLELLTEWFSKN